MANPFESVRVLWSATDEAFFRVAAELFSPAFLSGAGVLLASYDPEPAAELAGPASTSPAVEAPVATPVTA